MSLSREDPFEKRIKRKLSYEEAKVKAAAYCAYQERFQQEVRNKLYSYGLNYTDVEELLSYLISEGFVNEERFALAFAGGKFRLKKWGKVKIENELTKRNISSYCIKKALSEIEEEDYLDTIYTLLEKKMKLSSKEDLFALRKQLADYLIRKGFEGDLVWNILNDKIK